MQARDQLAQNLAVHRQQRKQEQHRRWPMKFCASGMAWRSSRPICYDASGYWKSKPEQADDHS